MGGGGGVRVMGEDKFIQGECVEGEGKQPAIKPAEVWHVRDLAGKAGCRRVSRKIDENSGESGAPKTEKQQSFKNKKIMNNIKCYRPIQVREEDGRS